MVQAQAFEGFFTLLPILLVAVISIVLRARAVRRKRQRESGKSEKQGESRKADSPRKAAESRGELFGRQWGANKKSGQPTSQPAASPAPGPQAPPARGVNREIYAYPPPLTLDNPNTPSEAVEGRKKTEPQREPEGLPFILNRMIGMPDSISRKTVQAIHPETADKSSGRVGPPARSGEMRRPVEARTAAARAATVRRSTQRQDLRDRMQARSKGKPPADAAAGKKGNAIAARLEKLPPLKRAVIWSEILGPPGGRQ